MKSRLYIVLFCTLLATQAFAQCGQRYKDMIFPNVTVTSDITYSTSNGKTLKLDVYEPTGDTDPMRPLMILAHGGSFIGGNKTQDNVVTQLCTNFAKRGYVTASISYRLAEGLDILKMYQDSSFAIEVVLRALSDGKSAIRFFRKDAATTNTYRINPNFILAGGNSAGAVLFMHAIYVDSVGELTPLLASIINNNGGFEGNSGNDGYSSELQGLVNCAGGLNVPEFVGPNSKPSANFHGTTDGTVPYNCALAVDGNVEVRLCGLGVIEPLYQQYGIDHVSVIFPGDGHTPWQSNGGKFMQVDTTTANFFAPKACAAFVGVKDVYEEAGVQVFPNPAGNMLNVSLAEYARYKSIQLVDINGKLVEEKTVSASNITFARNNAPAGIYLVRMIKADGTAIAKKVTFE